LRRDEMAKELDMKKYSRLFVTEARESLRISNDAMLQLENDPGNKELVDLVFRNCHTIKGMAGMMNMKVVMDTAHAVEDVLAAVRDGKLTPTGQVAEAVFDGLDALEGMVAAVEGGKEFPDNKSILSELQSVVAKAQEVSQKKKVEPPKKPGKASLPTKTLIVKLSRRCTLPSARAMVILKELGKTSAVIDTTPSEDEIEREIVFEELRVNFEPGEKYHDALKRISAMTDIEQVTFGGSDEPMEKWEKISRLEQAPVGAPSDSAPAQTVRVGMDKLDDLLDDIGELVIGRSRLLEKAAARDDYDLLEISALIDSLTSNIQSKVLEIRMIPLEMVMGRFPRMVRDLAKNEGKEIELVVEGGHIELDRTVVDRITEPIMHILRNSVDHGIEAPEDRTRAGKKPKGLIRVVASKQQDHVLIEVSDDGRGIDVEKIRAAAVKKGYMNEGQAANALTRDLIDLLFLPGFSTATEVTEVSGRGVGLDVVKKNVESLGGSVMVNTTKGHGTTFSLWLPFTLAIIEAMLVQISGQTYAVPMGTVVESHKYEESEVKMIRSREVVQLRGEVLPLVRMRTFFGIKPSEAKRDFINSIVVQSRDRRAALEVDELLGHQQIVVKSLDRRLRGVKGISGGTILGSGGIALILDVESILGG
jgi:two-component system, chemotaxis family, sensor kinase CheA